MVGGPIRKARPARESNRRGRTAVRPYGPRVCTSVVEAVGAALVAALARPRGSPLLPGSVDRRYRRIRGSVCLLTWGIDLFKV